MGERGAGRKMKIKALKEEIWIARRKWRKSVSRTLGVKIWQKVGFLEDIVCGGSWVRAGVVDDDVLA